jgi:hypothetical protein
MSEPLSPALPDEPTASARPSSRRSNHSPASSSPSRHRQLRRPLQRLAPHAFAVRPIDLSGLDSELKTR